MAEILLLQNKTRMYVQPDEMPSLAPMMLAHFAMPSSPKKVLELCSGNGMASFWMKDRGYKGEMLLLDKREIPLELAQMTIKENSFSEVDTLCGDLTTYRAAHPFELIICNPPFFDEKDSAKDDDRNAVRHENGLSPEKLCRAAALSIKQKGHFYVCYIPSRLTDMLLAMRNAGFEPKKIRFCRHTKEREPFLVLIDSIYKGGQGLSVMPDLCVFDDKDEYTEDMLDICERGYV